MLKDFIKIQFIIILILLLNVVATKKARLPQESKVKVEKTVTTKSKEQKSSPVEISYVSKGQALKHLFKTRY